MATPRPCRRAPGPLNSSPAPPDDDAIASHVRRLKFKARNLNHLLNRTTTTTTPALFSFANADAVIDERQEAEIKRKDDQDDIFGFLHTDNSRREDHDDGVVHEVDEVRRPEGAVYPPLMVGSHAPYWRVRSVREGDLEAMENERQMRVDGKKEEMPKAKGPRWWTYFPWKETQQFIGVFAILWLVIQGPSYISRNAGKIGDLFSYLVENPADHPVVTIPDWVDRKYTFVLPENVLEILASGHSSSIYKGKAVEREDVFSILPYPHPGDGPMSGSHGSLSCTTPTTPRHYGPTPGPQDLSKDPKINPCREFPNTFMGRYACFFSLLTPVLPASQYETIFPSLARDILAVDNIISLHHPKSGYKKLVQRLYKDFLAIMEKKAEMLDTAYLEYLVPQAEEGGYLDIWRAKWDQGKVVELMLKVVKNMISRINEITKPLEAKFGEGDGVGVDMTLLKEALRVGSKKEVQKIDEVYDGKCKKVWDRAVREKREHGAIYEVEKDEVLREWIEERGWWKERVECEWRLVDGFMAGLGWFKGELEAVVPMLEFVVRECEGSYPDADETEPIGEVERRQLEELRAWMNCEGDAVMGLMERVKAVQGRVGADERGKSFDICEREIEDLKGLGVGKVVVVDLEEEVTTAEEEVKEGDDDMDLDDDDDDVEEDEL